MQRTLIILLAGLLALVVPLPGRAQHQHHQPTPAQVASPQPAAAMPAAAQPPGPNVTGLERYRHFTADEPLTDWRKVNDTVRDIGGWQTYAQEAARAIKAEQDAKAPMQKGTKP